MTIWTLKQIVALAQANSSPYRELYAGLSPESATLLDLPVLSHERLMEIVHNKDAIRFFNTDTSAGIIYQSSATTCLSYTNILTRPRVIELFPHRLISIKNTT
ncbi:hypothetical protein PluTT01m_22950 [Photorhabdus laumondii subsp. laumondii]|nr:hypothetical protein [Photorhabdus laumondii]AXG49339.1 hypothetical protein PluTT01m_22950 [Photorhabdus laumondii subsp. laumondii]